MKPSLVTAVVVVIALMALITTATGDTVRPTVAPPARLTYQGHLLDSSGNPIANGSYEMSFSLWDAASGGTQVWGPEEQQVATQGGFFAVVLGATASLDAASLSAPLYLEIAVEGETLDPRQELASVAFALVSSEAGHADTADAAPWGGLSGVPGGFADGTDDVDDAVSWSEISAIVGAGANQVAAGNHHTWANLSGIPTGFADGTDNTDDTVSWAEISAIVGTGSSQVAAGNHHTWSNLTGVPEGFADGEDNEGGAAPGRGAPPATNTVTLLDSTGAGSGHASATIGADGLPIIAYYDANNGDLKVAHCEDVACTSATITTLDSTGDVGLYTSIALGADGLVVIAYHDNSAGDLKIAHCEDVTCSTAALSTLDTSGNAGQYTSTAIGADGLPLIAYRDVTNTNLKVAHCDDVACTSATLYTIDGAGIEVGEFNISLAIGGDGLGLIAYYDDTNDDLRVAHCANAACSMASVYVLDSTGVQGRHNSLVIGADGLGLIAYRDADATALDLKVAHCNNVSCSGATIYTVDGSVTDACQFTSITVGLDNLAVISYRRPTGEQLGFAHCINWSCSSAVLNTADGTNAVDGSTSVTIGTDGLPLIAYTGTDGGLRAAHCANPFCSPYFQRR